MEFKKYTLECIPSYEVEMVETEPVIPNQAMTPTEMLVAFATGQPLPDFRNTSYNGGSLDDAGHRARNQFDAMDYLVEVKSKISAQKAAAAQAKAEPITDSKKDGDVE